MIASSILDCLAVRSFKDQCCQDNFQCHLAQIQIKLSVISCDLHKQMEFAQLPFQFVFR